jgi:hypothetical protein
MHQRRIRLRIIGENTNRAIAIGPTIPTGVSSPMLPSLDACFAIGFMIKFNVSGVTECLLMLEPAR